VPAGLPAAAAGRYHVNPLHPEALTGHKKAIIPGRSHGMAVEGQGAKSPEDEKCFAVVESEIWALSSNKC